MNKQENINLPMPFKDKAHEALVSIWWTSILLKRFAQKFFKAQGSSEAQFNLLSMLKRSDEPLTQKELSQKLLVDKSNVTGLIDRMEQAGLITRDSVPGDRRSYHISMTPAGQKLVDQLEKLYWPMVADTMSSFTKTEHRELIRLTQKLRAALADKEN
jgi:DNA-binding MarR family transcriptional regulator